MLSETRVQVLERAEAAIEKLRSGLVLETQELLSMEADERAGALSDIVDNATGQLREILANSFAPIASQAPTVSNHLGENCVCVADDQPLLTSPALVDERANNAVSFDVATSSAIMGSDSLDELQKGHLRL